MFKIPKTRLAWADELGAWSGVIGATLISSNIGMEGWAFCVFIVSVLCFIYVGHVKDLQGITKMNIVFLFINLWGVWRWAVQPWLGI